MGVEVGVDAGVIVGWAVDVKAKGEVGEGDDCRVWGPSDSGTN